jgi:D-alanyl-D-alanine carboxypeptidase/D-alanyl-D-alanine-endopeptidase (penicillin-binding protein 4)
VLTGSHPTVVAALAMLAAAGPGSRSPLAGGIDRIVEAPDFEPAFWGIEVRDLAGGQVLYERNAGKSMMPASVTKLFATAAALDAYGPGARFRTTLETAAPLDANGRLAGDLYLVGRGDPGLGEIGPDGREGLDALTDALVAAGVRLVDGRVVGCDGAFAGERRGPAWEWGDLVWCYGAEVSGLSWNGSCADVIVSPGARPGDPATVLRRPVSSYYEVVSTAKTSAAREKSDLKLVRDLGSRRIEISGTTPAGAGAAVLSVALENPALFATTLFVERLTARGIPVTGGAAAAASSPPEATRVLAARESEPLARILEETNKPSDNGRAESLLRLVGRAQGEGSLERGVEAVGDFLARLGVDTHAASLADGSGLAVTDLATPRQIVDLLAAMDRHRYAQVFRASLPVAGRDGTLERRMRGTRAEGRVVAKTGTRQHVNALAGYVDTASGRRLAFAILLNHHTLPSHEGNAAIDAICDLLARQ